MGGYGWGETCERDFIDAIRVALDNGVNFFDTADTYGLGQSEITLAKGLGSRRREAVIQSKFGVRVMRDMVGRKTVYDNSPAYIKKALEGTLQRLKTDYVDIYTIHYRDQETPLEAVVETLDKLKKEGKVRYFGLSNVREDGLNELIPFKGLFATCQDEFSLVCRRNEADLMDVMEKIGALPMTWGSLGQGILTGKYGADVKFGEDDRRRRGVYVNFRGEKLKKNLEIVSKMKPIAEKYGTSCSATAIRFILDYLKESIVAVGVKSAKQMESNLECMGWRLDEAELKTLDLASREG